MQVRFRGIGFESNQQRRCNSTDSFVGGWAAVVASQLVGRRALMAVCMMVCLVPLAIHAEELTPHQEMLGKIIQAVSAKLNLPLDQTVELALVEGDALQELVTSMVRESQGGLDAFTSHLRSLIDYSGLYVPEERKIYLADDIVGDSDSTSVLSPDEYSERDFVLAHEVVHAIQHQHYPRLFDPSLYTDTDFALTAALEGHAILVALQVQPSVSNRLPNAREFREEALSAVYDDVDLTEQNRIPLLGLEFVTSLYAYGYGLALTEGIALLDNPPISSEQVLHDDRRHDNFLAIDLSRYRSHFDRNCREISEDTFGEIGLLLMISVIDVDASETVSDGWDGDRLLHAYCGAGAQLLWMLHWDTVDDAAEFERTARANLRAIREAMELDKEDVLLIRRSARRVIVFTGNFTPVVYPEVDKTRTQRVKTLRELHAHVAGEIVVTRASARKAHERIDR